LSVSALAASAWRAECHLRESADAAGYLDSQSDPLTLDAPDTEWAPVTRWLSGGFGGFRHPLFWVTGTDQPNVLV
jgi:hypothetical protein